GIFTPPTYKCPYGKPGDRLWVKETWAIDECNGDDVYGHTGPVIYYRATDHDTCGNPWRASRFMPRWASRITMEILSIRVERVQEISQEEAKAEGVMFWWQCKDGMRRLSDKHTEFRGCNVPEDKRNYIKGLHLLWDSIYAKKGYGWEANPFVWVIEFKRLEY
ncbi:MAG: hypothetical protein SVY53_03265, partial [Chloroflexota bacterium]|nr:hypothetical protein [Chloroflexota bacterium]